MFKNLVLAGLFVILLAGASYAQSFGPLAIACEGNPLQSNMVVSGNLASNGDYTMDFDFNNCHQGERIITNTEPGTPGIRSTGNFGPIAAFAMNNQYFLTVQEGTNFASYSCFETVTNATYNFDVLKSNPSISFTIGCTVDGSVKIDILTLLTKLLSIKID